MKYQLSSQSISVKRALAISGLIALTFTGCAAQPAQPAASTPAEQEHAAEWSYAGDNGPEHWGEFGAECENVASSHESPIAIATAMLEAGPADARVIPHYEAASFEVENNGHTIEAVPEDTDANSVEFDGDTYELQQFHFHASSEHTIDGKSAAAELHLVHQSETGKLLVLAVMLEEGAPNAALAELFEEAPAETAAEGEALETPINPAGLLPQIAESVQYEGSLTTPPCSEGVQWNVYLTPITVSAEQLQDFTERYSDNHRPVQPLHGRVLELVGAE